MRVLLDEHLLHRLRRLFVPPIEKEHFMKHRNNLFVDVPLATLVVLLLIFCTITAAPAQTTLSAEDIAEKALAATVYLEMKDKNGKTLGFGSGFFVKPNIIATNYHVIEGAAKGTAKLVGKYTRYNIEGVTATDQVNDLALIKVTAYGVKPLFPGNSDTVEIGETVYVAGNPKGLEGTFSDGIISSRRDRYTNERLQMTAPISPGSSGGPVLNRKGEVIGVSVAVHRDLYAQNLNFAIPSNYLRKLLDQSKSPAPPPPNISAKTYISWGGRKMEVDDNEGAIADFTEAIRLRPDLNVLAVAYTGRGFARYRLEQYSTAITDFTEAIRLRPDLVLAYWMRGDAKSNLGQHFAAIEDYNTAIQLKPDDADTYYARGNAKMDLGQHFAAIEDYNTAIRLKPDHADTYYARGNAKMDLGQHFAAIEDYNTAIQLKPNYAEAYINRGNAKAELEQYAAAIEDYDTAIQLKPDHPLAYMNRGNAKRNLGQHFAAIEDHNTAIRLKPGHADAYYNRGKAKAELEQYAAAIVDFDAAIRLTPDDADTYYARGLSKALLGRTWEAKQDLQTALRLAEKAGDARLKSQIEKTLQITR